MYAYCLNNSINYYVYASDFSGCSVDGIVDKTYTGSAIGQTVTVKYGSDTLVKGTDYTVSYSNNVNYGTATMTLKGTGKYVGTVTKTFKIQRADISKAKVTLSSTVMTYNTNYREPKVKVVWKNKTVSTNDYYVSYAYNRYCGRAQVTVTGRNNFQGNIVKYFKIVPRKTKITSAYNLSSGIKLKWKKIPEATGYIIYRNGKKYKTITSNTNYFTDTKTKNAANGKKYTYKIYAYAKVYVNGKYVTYKSAVSTAKTIARKR